MKRIVTVSRRWNNPKIETHISFDGIELKIDMDDFIKALKQEIGSVTYIFRKETFDIELDHAVNRVLTGIKEESIKAI